MIEVLLAQVAKHDATLAEDIRNEIAFEALIAECSHEERQVFVPEFDMDDVILPN